MLLKWSNYKSNLSEFIGDYRCFFRALYKNKSVNIISKINWIHYLNDNNSMHLIRYFVTCIFMSCVSRNYRLLLLI